MTSPTLPCPTCSCTGTDTHEDRHTGTNMDTCRTCGGEGFVPARTGETPEASFQPAPPSKKGYDLDALIAEVDELPNTERSLLDHNTRELVNFCRRLVVPLRDLQVLRDNGSSLGRLVVVDYTNHEGKRGLRTITPIGAYFGTFEPYHSEPQWLIPCLDHDRDAVRVYALAGIHAWDGVRVSGWAGIQADEVRIAAWVADRFGPASVINACERADRLLEEAIEMHQAVYAEAGAKHGYSPGCERAIAMVGHVYSKKAGDPRQEMGGVMTCALALGHRLGVRLDLAAQAELTRIEGLSKAHFDKRHQAKVDAGVAAQHVRPEGIEGRAP